MQTMNSWSSLHPPRGNRPMNTCDLTIAASKKKKKKKMTSVEPDKADEMVDFHKLAHRQLLSRQPPSQLGHRRMPEAATSVIHIVHPGPS